MLITTRALCTRAAVVGVYISGQTRAGVNWDSSCRPLARCRERERGSIYIADAGTSAAV